MHLIDSMLKFQSPEARGIRWPNYPSSREKNYLGTSGSSIMAYCLMKGARLRFLPAEYSTYMVKRHSKGICDAYLSTVGGRNESWRHLPGRRFGMTAIQEEMGTYGVLYVQPVCEDDAKELPPFPCLLMQKCANWGSIERTGGKVNIQELCVSSAPGDREFRGDGEMLLRLQHVMQDQESSSISPLEHAGNVWLFIGIILP